MLLLHEEDKATEAEMDDDLDSNSPLFKVRAAPKR